jgi:hypothetical protein
MKSSSSVVVNSGATLTIKADVTMQADARIVVEAGGSLIVDGARISGCGVIGRDDNQSVCVFTVLHSSLFSSQ